MSFMGITADTAGNMPEMEQQWAVKALHHAETYMKLLRAFNPQKIKLTPVDGSIHEHFRRIFPTLSVDVINEDDMKTDANKAIWRQFTEYYKDQIQDYHFGTLVRANSKEDLSQNNSILVSRAVFYAIEITRNKEGLNDWLFEQKQESS